MILYNSSLGAKTSKDETTGEKKKLADEVENECKPER